MNTKNNLLVVHNKLNQHFNDPGILPALCLILGLMLPIVSVAEDQDNDGIDDTRDNCTKIFNPEQRDSNNDGYGNICDADLDNNGLVSFADLNLFRSAFDSEDADADLDGSGRVSFADLNIFRSLFDKPPGPAGSGESISEAEAARFLTQTTFGPTIEAIQDLVTLGSRDAWLNEQFDQPATLQLPATRTLARKMCSNYNIVDGPFRIARVSAWWDTVINKNDQLRQRLAFALSEIFVVSDVNQTIALYGQYGLANYYDMLATNAFGNYRQLLEDVTLHPDMGIYLSMLRNEKAQPERNIRPDENYAREVMQLFSIGLHELNLDGTRKLAAGQPIPTYNQTDIEEFAKVFTGWTFSNASSWSNPWIGSGDKTHPMIPMDEFHEMSEKHLLNGAVLPAGQSARDDLRDALDNLFSHPNVGPFIGKQLIQRLVTSNPSDAYVARVATVFNNNGLGVRGDLKAVTKAILLDSEARTGHLNGVIFGKMREPMLRLSHLRRAFPVVPMMREGDLYDGERCGQGSYELYELNLGFPYDPRLVFGQDIMRAPSVFNFFSPNFAPPGLISNQALVAPEFQIMTENTLAGYFSEEALEIQATGIPGDYPLLNTDREAALADNTEVLLDHLNLLLLSGAMTAEMRAILTDHLNNTDFSIDENGNNSDEQTIRAAKARDAITLITASPAYLIQQ